MRLFKNLKVGTKLITILMAPVVVLVVLAYVGVAERSVDADDADRVTELTEFAQTTANLVHELELESIASGVFTVQGPSGSMEALTEQRRRTDEALTAYQGAITSVAIGADTPDLQAAIEQAGTRIDDLQTMRNSVDKVQTDPYKTVDQFKVTSEDLLDVIREVSKVAEQPELSRGLQSFFNLGKVKASTAFEASLMSLIIERGQFSRWPSPSTAVPCGSDESGAQVAPPVDDESCVLASALATQEAQVDQDIAGYEDFATAAQKRLLREAWAGDNFEDVEQGLLRLAESPDNDVAAAEIDGTAADEWSVTVSEKLTRLKGFEDRLVGEVLASSRQLSDDAQRERLLFLVFAGGAVAIAVIIAALVARATTGPLQRLTAAAYTLSTDKLPALVERLRNPEADEGESLAETLTAIEVDSKDEIGQLAEAFNSIQQVTIEVAEEQSQLLRKGIGDIFINLARRNQTLLDRQIEFIDQLESNEEDPDQLDNLFKLDHLATRMRRNAESLLVLAGAEPPRRRGRPVALADVVRVAIGEVEDFARIQLLSLDDATVGGNVAVDLAHLLSELMENATHFSPPDTMVEIVGHRSQSGYILSVSDQGIGMSADQLADANTQLARPPLVGLALSRSLGFIVIGRLAARFGIQVKLTSSPSGGVTALVTLPPDIVTFEGEEPAAAPASASSAAVAEEVADEPIILDDSSGDLLDELFDETSLAESEEFDRGLQSLVSDELPEAPIEPEVPVATLVDEPPVVEAAPVVVDEEPIVLEAPTVVEAPPAAEPVAAPAEAEPAAPVITAAGLVKRTPKKRSEDAVGGGDLGGSSGPKVSSGQSARSPEEIRQMLSRYRTGLNKAKQDADSDAEKS